MDCQQSSMGYRYVILIGSFLPDTTALRFPVVLHWHGLVLAWFQPPVDPPVHEHRDRSPTAGRQKLKRNSVMSRTRSVMSCVSGFILKSHEFLYFVFSVLISTDCFHLFIMSACPFVLCRVVLCLSKPVSLPPHPYLSSGFCISLYFSLVSSCSVGFPC